MSPLQVIRYASWAAIAALLVLVGFVLFGVKPGGDNRASVGGPFVLQASDGRMLDSASLKGKPYAVFFGFTQCPDVCPTTMFELSQNLAQLGPAAKDFRVYFITVDPERDTAALLKDYVGAFDPRIIGLVPKDLDELARIARDFRIFYRKVPTPHGYTMDHSAAVLLFDSKGEWTGTIDAQESSDARLAKLQRLLKS